MQLIMDWGAVHVSMAAKLFADMNDATLSAVDLPEWVDDASATR